MIVHLPVLLGEVNEILMPEKGGLYVDATVGMGGHAAEILGKMGSSGLLICIDRDEEALKVAQARFIKAKNVAIRRAKFSEMADVLDGLGIKQVDGILFDLGVSMLQLKSAERGFSFSSDAPLDMRMDEGASLKAADIVNKYPEAKIAGILYDYGEERLSRKIARAIVRARERHPIKSCAELAGIASGVYRGRHRIHPATRTFQALRIAVNDELGELRAGLGTSLDRLVPGGRLAVISYHSLEDRIVKNFLRDAQREGALSILTKKPLTPGPEELRKNPSARSAKLRGARKAA